jgi:hypothetical protein
VEFQENGDIQLFCNEGIVLKEKSMQGWILFKFHSNILLANKARLKT